MANSRVPKETVAAAVKKAGDHVQLGRHLNATYQAVSYWLRHGAPHWRRDAIEAYLNQPAPAAPLRGSAGRPLAVTSAAGRKAAETRKRRRAAGAEVGA